MKETGDAATRVRHGTAVCECPAPARTCVSSEARTMTAVGPSSVPNCSFIAAMTCFPSATAIPSRAVRTVQNGGTWRERVVVDWLDTDCVICTLQRLRAGHHSDATRKRAAGLDPPGETVGGDANTAVRNSEHPPSPRAGWLALVFPAAGGAILGSSEVTSFSIRIREQSWVTIFF